MHARLVNPLRCSAGVRVWDSPASLERLPATGKLGCLKKKEKKLYGGPGRDRTGDLFHAMEARSQLRHRPTSSILAYGGELSQTADADCHPIPRCKER